MTGEPAGTTPDADGQDRARYQELRGRLVALGYLDRPLDRFLLAGFARPGSFVRLHAVTSAKVAVVAGPLLGLLFAFAVVIVNVPRFSHPADQLLLALYYAIAFVTIVFLLEYAAGLSLAAIVRWRGGGVKGPQAAAARAGFAVSLMVSAYLAIWWRGRAASIGGPILDLAGFGALVLVNTALFRVTSLGSLAALIRASDLPGRVTPSPRSQAGFAIAAAAILAIGLFVAPRAGGPPPPSPYERLPASGRMIVIAWDGMPADFLLARSPDFKRGGSVFIAQGRTSGFLARLEGEQNERPSPPPSFWTGVATGRVRSDHGVEGVTLERPAGLSSPLGVDVPLGTVLKSFLPGTTVAVSSGLRRARALWEILAEKEGIGVVGWWTTWPAQEPADTGRHSAIVSDRALFGSLSGTLGGSAAIVPSSLANSLAARRKDDLATVQAEEARFFGPALAPNASWLDAGTIDGYASLVAGRLLDDTNIADLFLYLPGLDILRGRMQSGSSEVREDVSLLSRYSDYVEFLVARLNDRLGPEDWLIVIGYEGRAGAVWRDPGPISRGGEGRPGRRALPGWEAGGSAGETSARVIGWVFVQGPGARTGEDSEPWAALDIAPTLLTLRGFPRSREMPGRFRSSFLLEDWKRRFAEREIATYGRRVTPTVSADLAPEVENETMERLRALGYVR